MFNLPILATVFLALATLANAQTENGLGGERDFSQAEIKLLQELETERIGLQRRAQALELRERLVDLAETRLSTKITELEKLQRNISSLLNDLSDKEDAELDQLARIYSDMKPADAARIMNALDNTIVYDVIRRMATKDSAKVMELLVVPKARFISELLAQENQLPALP